jgi:hypothetical protein
VSLGALHSSRMALCHREARFSLFLVVKAAKLVTNWTLLSFLTSRLRSENSYPLIDPGGVLVLKYHAEQ